MHHPVDDDDKTVAACWWQAQTSLFAPETSSCTKRPIKEIHFLGSSARDGPQTIPPPETPPKDPNPRRENQGSRQGLGKRVGYHPNSRMQRANVETTGLTPGR